MQGSTSRFQSHGKSTFYTTHHDVPLQVEYRMRKRQKESLEAHLLAMLGAFDKKNTYNLRSTRAPQHCLAGPTFTEELG